MTFRNSHCWEWTVLCLAIGTVGCAPAQDPYSAKERRLVNLSPQESRLIDDYAKLDRRAAQGVDKAAAAAALSGDGFRALLIGSEFAQKNMLSEARFWFQVSAENGNGVGMQRFSTMIRTSDCRRANYWLERALTTDDIRGETRIANERDLELFKSSCN